MNKLLPLKILIVVWSIVILSSLFVPHELVAVLWGDTRIMSATSLFWILLCFLAFWGGSFIERTPYAGRKSTLSHSWRKNIIVVQATQLQRSLSIVKFLLLLAGSVIGFRFAWCVIRIGGLSTTLEMMFTKPLHFKFDYWQQSNIHGIGMFADFVIACIIFSLGVFALLRGYKERSSEVAIYGYDIETLSNLYRKSVIILLSTLGTATLHLLLSNERKVFAGGFIAGLFVYILIRKSISLKKSLYLLLFLISIWVFVEAGRSQLWGEEGFDVIFNYARNQLLLYFVAGLRNMDTVLNFLPDYSYGRISFNFLFTSLKLDNVLLPNEAWYGITPYTIRPGYADIPLFGMAFADFGYAGLGYFIVLGFFYQKLHRKAVLEKSFFATQIYGYFLVALVFSFVMFLPALSRFWLNVVAILIINYPIHFGKLPSFRKALVTGTS